MFFLIAAILAVIAVFIASRQTIKGFNKDLEEERIRLREQISSENWHIEGDLYISSPSSTDATNRATSPIPRGTLGSIDGGRFAELLVDYYAYGLTQARSSFHTSQRFAGTGTVILLSGIIIAIWRSETTGDLYSGIVTSSVGAVIALIGTLFHRRADVALRHMSEQSQSLRHDMQNERSAEQAIALLSEVTEPNVKARLQAGLIMKLAGSGLPNLGTQGEENI